jgi:hypothetical protein
LVLQKISSDLAPMTSTAGQHDSTVNEAQLVSLRSIIQQMKSRNKKNPYRIEYTQFLYRCWNELPFAAEYSIPTRYTTSDGMPYDSIVRNFVRCFRKFFTYDLDNFKDFSCLEVELPTEASKLIMV